MVAQIRGGGFAEAELRPANRPVDGLLGADFFQGRVAQFDYAGQVLRLLPSGTVVDASVVLPLRAGSRGVLCSPPRERLPLQMGAAGTGCAKPVHWVTKDIERETSSPQVCIGLADVQVPFATATVQIGKERIGSVEVGLHKHEIFVGEAGLLGQRPVVAVCRDPRYQGPATWCFRSGQRSQAVSYRSPRAGIKWPYP